ncbi:hypothetical protein FH972_024691 [Carpinus fangiana]|uniref:Putative gamma-glutamylcyclotransferase n=1 Tax=Carpinus fangiana TaxID=176857 RepID=A0A5N6KYQ3_9ROSI|nr:hypothetical protein FH972_024691 [Carpinus fangiana]
MATAGPHTAFFYGTLMASSVVHRVTGAPRFSPSSTSKPYYTTRPAILHAHRRRRVLHADYPAVTPSHAVDTVRGTFITGLSDSDIFRLDKFEGEEYERRKVRVQLLSFGDEALVDGNVSREHEPADEWAETQTYIWIASESELDTHEWDFDEFVKTKMWRWSGDSEEFAASDAAAREIHERDPTGGRQYFVSGKEDEMITAAV